MTIETRIIRAPAPGEAFVLAAFSYRYDAHLVPDLLANLAPVVHGWVALDDRASISVYSSEPQRRRALLAACRRLGADWILSIDPDERLEDGAAARMPLLTAATDRPIWKLDFFELFTQSHYRADGVWGGRLRQRLFPVTADIGVPDQVLHATVFNYATPRPVRHADLCLYHLRMMTPARRQLRRDLYATLDSERHMQKIGYDYLVDDRSARLVPISLDRTFSPPHLDDGGLWAPAPGQIGPVQADPVTAQLRLLVACRTSAAPANAADIAADIADQNPDQTDFMLLAAATAIAAGRLAEVNAHLDLIAQRDPGLVVTELLRALALPDPALPTPTPHRADLQAPDALWRRWVTGAAVCDEGAEVAKAAPVAVVVIGFRAQPGIAAAVRSVLAQGQPVEIVVVNSGGGDVRAVLGPLVAQVRLIDIAAPHYVGVARNVGIDVSFAPVVAFLAADCIAGPGWITGRLQRHQAGAVAVSSAIIPGSPGNLVAWIASANLRWTRWPSRAKAQATQYGLSYARRLFAELGYFPTGLRGSEDTVFNRRLQSRHQVDWSPDIVTLHADPMSVAALYADMRQRGFWRAQYDPWRKYADTHDRATRTDNDRRQRCADSRNNLASVIGQPALGDVKIYRLLAIAAAAGNQGFRRGLDRVRQAADLARQADIQEKTNPQAACDLAAQCVALDPQHAPHFLHYARLLFALRRTDEAASVAATGTAIDPSNAALVGLRCEIAYKTGQHLAAADIAHACAIAAPTESALWILAYQYAARMQDFRRALACMQLGFLADPANPVVNGFLSHAHQHLGRTAAAAARRQLQTDLQTSLSTRG